MKDIISKFSQILVDISQDMSLYRRQQKFDQFYSRNKEIVDIFLSISLELNSKITINTIKNNTNYFDFKSDLGLVFYYLITKDISMVKTTIKDLYYPAQIILYFTLGKLFERYLTKEYLLLRMEHFYTTEELVNKLTLPELIELPKTDLQNIKHQSNIQVQYPLSLSNIPKGYTYQTLIYFDGKSERSNIKVQSIRKELKRILPIGIGIVGILLKDRKYKNRYNILIVYVGKNAVKYYKEGCRDNLIEKYKDIFKLTNFLLFKGKLINNEAELVKYIRNSKKLTIIKTKSSFNIVNIQKEYLNLPVVDYIYSEEFDVLGLKVKYDDNIYPIYFNVENTNYIANIINKLIRVQVFKYKDIVVSLKYNSELKEWSNISPHCILCGSTLFKHKARGVCYSCYNNINKETERMEKPIKVKDVLENTFSFETTINNVKVYKQDDKLIYEGLSGKQLSWEWY